MYKTIEEFYEHCRKPHWPESYSSALLDPLISRIVAIQWKLYSAPATPTSPGRPRKVRTLWSRDPTPGAVDLKRLAANDKDD